MIFVRDVVEVQVQLIQDNASDGLLDADVNVHLTLRIVITCL